MINIQCNLTKVCRILVTHTESFLKNMGIICLGNQDFDLFNLILYILSTIFQLCRNGSSWVEPVLS